MWKAEVNVLAFNKAMEQETFFAEFMGKTREDVWNAAAVWVGDIAEKVQVFSLYVEITNLMN
jgi:hypothetical protein